MEGAILEAVCLSMSAETLLGPFAFVVSKFCSKSWTSWGRSFGHSVKGSRSLRSEKSKWDNVWLKYSLVPRPPRYVGVAHAVASIPGRRAAKNGLVPTARVLMRMRTIPQNLGNPVTSVNYQ